MKTPPLAGSFVRIGVGLLLCAACFQAGRSYQELSASAAEQTKADPDAEPVASGFVGPVLPSPAETATPSAPGDPAGHGGDVITPLNVRDPSALVMGPGDYHRTCPPLDLAEPEPKPVEPKPRKMKEGRLLELLKKADKKSSSPQRY
jgi:hypothetical protein